MRLYYSPGACSLAPHIILEELKIPFEAKKVDLRQSSPELLKLNPLGAVPVLETDQGEILTEAAVILQYIADLKPEARLAPPQGTRDRYQLQAWLNFIATELHKGFSPMFSVDQITQNPEAKKEIIAHTKEALGMRFTIVCQRIGDQEYLLPAGFSIADAYLFTILNWTKYFAWDISKEWPQLARYYERARSRESTQRALRSEGLLH